MVSLKRCAFVLLLSFLCAMAATATPVAHPLADINTTVEESAFPLLLDASFVALGSTLFYTADDGIHGIEVWKSDGTAAGTALVADVCPGVCSSLPWTLTAAGGAVFFAASDGAHGRELWRTDGTAAGTRMVADVWPGLAGGFAGRSILAVGGQVYFAGDDGVTGPELWVSDGTAAGTHLVAEIRPGAEGSLPEPRLAGTGAVLLTADDGVHGREPWITDGTAAGTHLVADINPGAQLSTVYGSAFGLLKEWLTLGAGTFLFPAHDGTGTDTLWATDGTAAGTVKLGGENPMELTEMNGAVYFTAATAATGYELWKTDGTPGGTGMLVEIRPGSINSTPIELTRIGSRIFFRGFDDAHGQELWATDGTAAGTVLVKDVRPGTDSSFQPWIRIGHFFVLPGGLFFFADDGVNGLQIWHTDGTAAGTSPVADIGGEVFPASLWFYMGGLTIGDRFFFRGLSLAHGNELWSTDGTDAGTAEVADLDRMTSSLFISYFTGAPPEPSSWGAVGGKLLFEANDGTAGAEPWVGTPGAGATLLADTLPGGDWSYLYGVTPLGGITLFTSPNAPAGGLWRTDGTPGGTAVIPGVPAGSQFTPFAGALFYAGEDAATGQELRRTDGTAAGSSLVKEIHPGADGARLSGLTPLGAALFFSADDGTTGNELWQSDGTAAGTVRVKDVQPGAVASWPDRLTAAGGTLFFTADDGVNGRELWKSDGTAAGTLLVKDVRSGAAASMAGTVLGEPSVFAAVGSTFFFVADDGISGEELWKSDGTAAGTVPVADILPGGGGSEPRWLTAAGGRLFFTAEDGTHGRELWVSDGTAAGTVLFDLEAGAGASLPRELARIGTVLVFSAFDAAHGVEAWVSDGSAAGTVRLDDIAPGTLPATPSQFKSAGAHVFFAANDATAGFEPWYLARTDLGPALRATMTASGGFFEGGSVVYTIVLTNSGRTRQADNPGAEMTDVLPAGLALVGASASAGTASINAGTRTVTWNGAVPAGGTVTVTVQATVVAGTLGQSLVNQAALAFDADPDGANEAAGVSDDPGAGGTSDPTVVTVGREALDFHTLPPCRIADTRGTSALGSGVARTFAVAGSCGVPAGAKAVAANLTALDATGTGSLVAWPAGTSLPGTSNLNFVPGLTRANNAVLALGAGGVDVRAAVNGGGSVQVLIDVSGYFQ
jgi:uncharacterized repeat protein (TIGR01451 family)